MKKISLKLMAAIVFISAACSQETIQPEPALLGQWTDYNVIYTFNQDFSYSMNYLRKGRGQDTVSVDSVFGHYNIDKKRSNISFEVSGYRTKEGQLIYKPLNGTAWHYNIKDSIMTYQSRTAIGQLYKKK